MPPIDAKLKQQLTERGLFDKIKELESGVPKKFFVNIPYIPTPAGRLNIPIRINQDTAEATKQFFTPGSTAQKKVLAPVAKIVAPLGEHVGASLAAPKTIKMQEESQKIQEDLGKQVLAQLRDPNKSREQKVAIAKKFSQTNPNIIAQVPELNATTKKILGSAVQTFLSVYSAGGLKTVGGKAPTVLQKIQNLGPVAGKITSVTDKIQKLGTAETLAKGIKLEKPLAPMIAGKFLRTAQTFAEGAAFGAAAGLTEGKEGKDVADEALAMGALNVVLPAVVGKVLKVGIGETSKMARATDDYFSLATAYLKDMSKSKPGKDLIETAIDTATARNKATIKQTLAAAGAKVGEALTTELDSKLIDRLQAINKFDHFYDVKSGNTTYNTPQSSYVESRLFPGVTKGKYQVAESDFDNMFATKYPDIKDEALTYVKYLDQLNRVSRKQSIEGGKTIDEINTILRGIEDRVGVKNLARLEQAVIDYNNYNKNYILDEYVSSGLKSQADIDRMIAANPNFTPHEVLDFYEAEAANAFTAPGKGGSGSFNVYDTAVKAAKGSERTLADVRTATLYRTQQAINLAERNKVARNLVDKVRTDPEAFGWTPMRTADQVMARKTAVTELVDNYKKEKELLKADKMLSDFQDKAASKIKNKAYVEENAAIVHTRSRIKDSNEKIQDLTEQLFNEVDVSERPHAKGNELLTRINAREKKLTEIQTKLNQQLTDFNFTHYRDVKQQTEAIERIKGTRRQLNKAIADREYDITEIQQTLKELRDQKIKPIDYRKEGFEKLTFYNNGIREEWLGPTDLVNAMRNLDTYQVGFVGKWLALPAQVLRAGATRFNLAFNISNFPRDIQTQAGISKYGFTREQLGDALNEVTNLNNPQTREFYTKGGAFGGLVGAERPSTDILAASKRTPIFNAPFKLGEVVESVSERFENGVRYAVYKNAIANGMTPEMAAFEARNATVDFAKMGTLIGAINQFIPFLNARTQGLVNTLTAIDKDPTKFVRRQLLQSVYPAMYLHAYNSNFESYKNIPTEEKENYWIFVVSEEDGVDTDGRPIKVPNYIKIKKGEVQQMASNVTERYLSSSEKEDPRGTAEFLTTNILKLTPVDVGSFGPLTTPVEIMANYDLFRGKPIEPEYQEIVPGGKKYDREDVPTELRANKWTGATTKKLSEMGLDKLGLSPARIEFITNKLFATVGKDLLTVVDMTQTGIDRTGIENNKATNYQIVSKWPIFRSFIGSSSMAEKIAEYETIDKIEKDFTAKVEMQREVEARTVYDLLQATKKTQGYESAAQLLTDLKLDKDMITRLKRIAGNENKPVTLQAEVYSTASNNQTKALYLIETLNKIDSYSQKEKLLKDVKPSAEVRKLLKDAAKKNMIKPATQP